MIITISGTPGSGKSTVGKMLAEKLGWKHYSTGDMRRRAATSHGMTIEEWNAYGETNPETDTIVDNEVAELGRAEDNFIIDGRLAWHFIPHAFKVFITVDEKEGAERIFGDLKSGKRSSQEQHKTIDELIQANRMRTLSDEKRYAKYYPGVIWNDLKTQDLILDSTNLSPEATVEQILAKVDVDKGV